MKDNRKKIVSKVSFLAGIQTGTEEKTGWTEHNKTRNFKIVLLKLSFDKKIKTIKREQTYNNIFVIW